MGQALDSSVHLSYMQAWDPWQKRGMEDEGSLSKRHALETNGFIGSSGIMVWMIVPS